MRAIVERIDMLDAVKFAAQSAGRSSTIPILGTIKIWSDYKGQLSIAATDLVQWASCAVMADVAKCAGCCVDARALQRFCTQAPKGAQIEIVADNNRARIIAGSMDCDLPSLPAVDFPARAEENAPTVYDVDKSLAGSLQYVCRSAETGETRYYLCGVHIDGENLVGTNGNALHLWRHDLRCEPATIPGNAIPSLAAILSDGGKFGCNENSWCAQAGGKVLSGKVVDGSFPDYRKILPSIEDRQGFVIDSEELLTALDRATLKGTGTVRLEVSGGVLAIVSKSVIGDNAGGVGSVSVEVSGDDCSAAMNAAYLRAAISGMGGLVKVFLGDLAGGLPSVIVPQQEGLSDWRAVIMGVRAQ